MESRLRKLRLKAGLSQADLAEMVNVHQTAVSQWETGKNSPDVEVLKKLADILSTTTDYLLGRDAPQGQHVDDDEALEYLDELHKRPEMKTLFQVTRKAKKEDIETAITIIEALKKRGAEEE